MVYHQGIPSMVYHQGIPTLGYTIHHRIWYTIRVYHLIWYTILQGILSLGYTIVESWIVGFRRWWMNMVYQPYGIPSYMTLWYTIGVCHHTIRVHHLIWYTIVQGILSLGNTIVESWIVGFRRWWMIWVQSIIDARINYRLNPNHPSSSEPNYPAFNNGIP